MSSSQSLAVRSGSNAFEPSTRRWTRSAAGAPGFDRTSSTTSATSGRESRIFATRAVPEEPARPGDEHARAARTRRGRRHGVPRGGPYRLPIGRLWAGRERQVSRWRARAETARRRRCSRRPSGCSGTRLRRDEPGRRRDRCRCAQAERSCTTSRARPICSLPRRPMRRRRCTRRSTVPSRSAIPGGLDRLPVFIEAATALRRSSSRGPRVDP